jgi:pheromone shutdown-related protein TraB
MSSQNVTRMNVDGKEIIIIGTAHVSKHSADEVKMIIEQERPDSVCIELDEQRYQSIINESKWNEMDIFKVIKEKKATLLLVNLIISSFQKRMAKQIGIKPGQEMIQGIESAKEINANLVLADRNIQTTFARIWHGVGFFGKGKLMMQVFFSIFNKESISEEELEKLKSQDMLNSILDDFTKSFPRLKVPLIDERDQYLAQKTKEAPGKKIVSVVGAAHVPGMTKEINKENDIKALSQLPPKSKVPKLIGWFIPLLIISMIAYTFYANPSAGFQQTVSWILWNGSFAALGAGIALAHPLAIITAFLIAPISSLNPLMAAGWFAGLTQVYLKRPNVSDFMNLSDDVFTIKGFWNNKVTRVLLIVTLTNLGSSVGTLVGGLDIVRLFLQLF